MDQNTKVGKADTTYRDKEGNTVTIVKEQNNAVGKSGASPSVEKVVISRRVEK